MIHTGDCIEVMAGMPADSVDAVVTDPPYGLEFMGKAWDKFVPANRRRPEWDGRRRDGTKEQWEGSVADRGDGKPGGPSFSVDSHYNPNTKCRICGKWKFDKNRCRCESPDWEPRIRHEAPTQYLAFQAWCEAWGREALRVTKPSGYLLAFGGTRTHHRLVCGLEDAGWIIRDELDWIYASGFPKGKANLKPAHEPIVLARKPGPLRPLAIDATRIPGAVQIAAGSTGFGADREDGYSEGTGREYTVAGRWPSNLLLSDPELFDVANPYVVGSGVVQQSGWRNEDRPDGALGVADSFGAANVTGPHYEDGGGYSRFFRIPSHDSPSVGGDPVSGADRSAEYPSAFLVPKADRADREPVLRGQLTGEEARTLPSGYAKERGDGWSPPLIRENSHPTVKPVDLMRHLVRLVTPQGGTVLDPFLGSGSTAIACELEGFPWIGIEKEPEYVAIAEARLNGTQRGLGLDVAAPVRKRELPNDAKLAKLGKTYKNHQATSIWGKPEEAA